MQTKSRHLGTTKKYDINPPLRQLQSSINASLSTQTKSQSFHKLTFSSFSSLIHQKKNVTFLFQHHKNI